MIARFFRWLFCTHDWKLIEIAWDGEVTHECRKCGGHRHVPLDRQ